VKTLNYIHRSIIQAVKRIFNHPHIIETWKNDLQKVSESPDNSFLDISESFKALLVILDKITDEKELKISEIESWIDEYSQEIYDFVQPFIDRDMQQKHNPIKDNKDIVVNLLNNAFVESSSALIYHKLRDVISKNEFDTSSMYPTARISDEKKRVEAIAQVRNSDIHGEMGLTKEEIEQWKNLTAQAITSMDDLTADIFDIISIIWMKQAKHKDQMIRFHTDDALNLRKVQGRGGTEVYQTGYRKKDRDEVMKRLAALATIWIRIERDKLRFVDAETKEVDELDRVQFNPLFIIDSVTVAYRNNEPVGIYECSIKPGEILANFLYGAKKSSGLLALKTLQYNPVKQKYHKRLARYLSWQWRIRQKKADYLRPYHIGGEKGLLNVIGMEVNNRFPMRTKESFEEILDTLQEDGIIQYWEYTSEYDEKKIGAGNKKWLDYWLNCKVRIIPPEEIISLYKNMDHEYIEANNEQPILVNPIHMLKNMVEREQSNNDLSNPYTLVTPENVKRIRKERGLNITQAAAEIGISRSTLSRYESGQIQNPTPENLEKMYNWLNQ
jgi:DNA-binding transcriptional regulator YiaG